MSAKKEKHFKDSKMWGWRDVQWLGVLMTLRGELGLVPTTHISTAPGDLILSSSLHRHLHTFDAHKNSCTHIHKNNKQILFKKNKMVRLGKLKSKLKNLKG